VENPERSKTPTIQLSVKRELRNAGRKIKRGNTMDKQIKHWITVLQRIKTELLWTPADQFPSTEKIEELIKEMERVVEERERMPSRKLCNDEW
jgi:hypothetical protein